MTYKISQTTLRGKGVWVLARMEGGKRHRSYFSTKNEAEQQAAQLKGLAKDDRAAALELSPTDREALMRACVTALDRGHDVVSLVALLNGSPAPSVMTCQRGLDLYLDHLRAAGRAPKYLENVKWPLLDLVGKRGKAPLSVIDKDSIVGWLKGRVGWTRQTMRSRARNWFKFAVIEGWLGTNPTDRVPAVAIVSRSPTILSVEQHEACLRYLEKRPRGLAWYVLTTICGLRPHEAEAMSWDHVLTMTSEPVVRVDAISSKMRARRVVDLSPQAIVWLEHAKKLGSELPISNQPRRRILRPLARSLGWKRWMQDITRHTAASYQVAHSRNLAAVADQLGHSTETLQRHYKAVVTREQAAAFYAILPTGHSTNTVPVDFKAQAHGLLPLEVRPRDA